jgi:hypothetical protein
MLAAGCGGSSSGSPDSFVVVRSQDNPIIPGDSTFTELVRLELESGRYEVGGKVELHNRVLFVSQELDSAGSVVLGCDGSGSSEHGAFGAYISIRAIEVGSVTTSRFTP